MKLSALISGFLALMLLTAIAPAQQIAAPSAPTTQPAAAPIITHDPIIAKLAKPSAARPVKLGAADSCTTSDCHANVKSYKVVHGPVNVNACDACHKIKSEQAHTFEAVRTKADACTFCHKIEPTNLPVLHKPFADGQCLGCHNPHGGTNNKFLRGNTMSEMCAGCHQSVVGDKKMIHGPVAAGACDSCHQGHASKFPKLLPAQGTELCESCHTEMKAQLKMAKFIHKAVEQDCTKCHDAHASNYRMQIKSEPVALCTSCHEHDKIKVAVENASHKHSIVTKDQACLNCHTPHGGNLTRLMKAPQVTVCMKCHDKKITPPEGGRTIAAIAEVLDPNMSKHGPIRDGDCGGCHNPHGSDQFKLLAKPYPETFYTGFALEKYDLCFNCHDKNLVLTEKTEGLTGFRNGQQNLHFLHVNKSDRGRTCRACHSTHASAHDLHVRDAVPYGSWELPINFQKTPTGGSCAPGCHKPFEYDRKTPVIRPALPTSPILAPTSPQTTPPAVPAAPAPAPAVVSDGKDRKS